MTRRDFLKKSFVFIGAMALLGTSAIEKSGSVDVTINKTKDLGDGVWLMNITREGKTYDFYVFYDGRCWLAPRGAWIG